MPNETDRWLARKTGMVALLLNLARMECEVASLALAAGQDAEKALGRAAYYLRARGHEAHDSKLPMRQKQQRIRAWLRGAV